jgi:hypothetical protein
VAFLHLIKIKPVLVAAGILKMQTTYGMLSNKGQTTAKPKAAGLLKY